MTAVGRWLGSTLPAGAVARLRRARGLVAVVATAGDAGPDTAPVSLVRVRDASRLLLGLAHSRVTLANLRAGGRVAVSLLVPPDMALTVAGAARVVAERLDGAAHVAAVLVEVDAVTDDRHPAARLTRAIGFRWDTTEREAAERALLAELERLPLP